MTINNTQKLLLVDDIPENLFALESILEDEGREFIKANSGEEALKLLLKHDIDLILLDVQMPGMDGFETAQLIRGTQRTRQIPIIFVTAISKEQKHIFKGYESGAVDYMFKPLEPTIVQSKVSIFLELAKQRRQLEQQNMELIEAKRNTDNIFANVEEGIFLLDKSLKIKPQYSKALENIFEESTLENTGFLSMMEKRTDSETLESIKDFLELMFQPEIDEDNLIQLNPLIEAPIKNDPSQTEKYLTFNFKRIFKKNLDELMVTVIDRTARILLKQQLKESEEEKKKQYELMNILKLEPMLLREFLQQTEKELNNVESTIKKGMDENSTELVYRLIHSVKGNAGLLNLTFISEKAHELEETVIEIKSLKKFDSGFNDKFIEKLEEIKDTVNTIYDLIEQMRTFYENFNKKSEREGQLMIKAVEDLLLRLNNDLDKEAELNADRFDTKLSFSGNFLLIKDIMVQLVRNAMVHGIESPLKREQLGKPRQSQIILSSEKKNGYLIIKLRDDGQGLQLESIRQKAIDSGKWKAADLSQWTDEQIAKLIFESGISTKNKANLSAGRGIGMGIVMQKIDEINGSISIDFEKGKYTEFTLTIPAKE
jgi:CheY-like chemotaxis protein/HPt (histidine-containing phosphotransfer) domain-containing protein